MLTIHLARRVSIWVAVVLFVVILSDASIEAKRKVFVPGRPAIVFDERLSALRSKPDLKAPLEQRLRRGRIIGILGASRKSAGAHFLQIAISRNTRGWILADAVIRPASIADAERLMRLIEETNDDFAKAKLARLCADEFRATRFAPRALMILGETAEDAAERLSRDAKRRIPGEEAVVGSKRRFYFLNFVGLDRYNRIGVTFDFDPAGDRIVYDGGAFRELLRRYPRSAEAQLVRQRLVKK
jgi:hypothetical protein